MAVALRSLFTERFLPPVPRSGSRPLPHQSGGHPPAIWFSLLLLLFSLACSGTADALVIIPTWDSSVTTLPNAAQWESGVSTAIAEFEQALSTAIVINITFKANPGTSIFGHSYFSVHNTYTFDQVVSALQARATSSADKQAMAHLTLDPTNGGRFVLNDPQAKALGFRSATDPGVDGTVTIGQGYTFTFDPLNRAVAGKYDFIGIVEHEISEVMGRAHGLGGNFGSGIYSSVYEPFDLFRFTARNAPTVDPNSTGVYFSLDSGATNIRRFYGSPDGDLSDWAAGNPNYIADAFNNNSFSGYKNGLTNVGLIAMDVIGYTRTPEPGSSLLMAAGALTLLGVGRASEARREN